MMFFISLVVGLSQAETRILMRSTSFKNMDKITGEKLYLALQKGIGDASEGYLYKNENITIISSSSGLEDTISSSSLYYIDVEANKVNNQIHAYFYLKDHQNKILLKREFHDNLLYLREQSSRIGWLIMNEYFGADQNPDTYKIIENQLHTVQINTFPDGVLVYKNENENCISPCSISSSQRRISLRFEANGYKSEIRTYDFTQGPNIQNNQVTLEPNDGRNYIQSIPSGAKVWIQDQEMGATPLYIDLEPNTYTIKLEEGCSSTVESQINIASNKSENNIFKLQPLLVENPIQDMVSDVYIEQWDENGELKISTATKEEQIPKCSTSIGYRNQTGHFVSVSLQNNEDSNLHRATSDQKNTMPPEKIVGQWVDPFRFPDPRALFQYFGFNRVFGEYRGKATSMIYVTGGKHTIPSRDLKDETGQYKEIDLGHDFYVFEKEVSQYLYEEVTSKDVAYFQKYGEDRPIEQVTWIDAVIFANLFSKKMNVEPCYEINNGIVTWPTGFSCDGYRLPTKDEWYIVAKMTLYSENTIYDQARLGFNSFGRTHTSCSMANNALGVCDIFGNVAEWVWDSTQAKTEREKTIKGGDRYVCGGHMLSNDIYSSADYCSASAPSTRNMNTGFRLVRTIEASNTPELSRLQIKP